MEQLLKIYLVTIAVLVISESQMAAGAASEGSKEETKMAKTKQSGPLALPDGSILVPVDQTSPQYFYPQQFPFQQVDYYLYPDTPVPPRRSSSRNLFRILLLLMFNFLNTTPAPTITSTIYAGSCEWTPWTSCSAVCKGSRSRSRTCNGNTQSESEICNTQVGFLSDGIWYRASNCYDYNWVSTVTDYDAAVAACSGMNARLASTGMRDNTVRTEIFVAFAESSLTLSPQTYIGVTDLETAGVYVWSDGFVGYPGFWQTSQPGLTSERCHFVRDQNPWSLNDVTCSSTIGYLCERQSQ